MRYVQGAAIAIALLALSSSAAFGQSGLSIPPNNSSYQLVSSTRFSLTQFYYTYRAVLSNSGPAVTGVTGTVVSITPGVLVVAGQGTVHFDPVPASGQVTSTDTFTVLVNRTVPFAFSDLQWSFQNPFADPGPNQTVALDSTVTLNASGSTNPGGIGSLTYNWTLQGAPAGSTASLSNASTMVATFVPDVSGTYTAQLTVSNGLEADSAIVTISTENSPPVANAGPNQTVAVGTRVQLNGSRSSDVDGMPLTYTWNFVSLPPNSAAAITSPASVTPAFTADVAGTFIVQLVVNDGAFNSQPSTVTVTTGNTPPVANAGSNQQVNVNSLVQLNGSGSTDVNGNPLTYVWTLNTTQAPGSRAVLSNPTAVNPTFTADVPGTYVAQLIVNDGFSSSQPATVTISTNAVQAPTAYPGLPQTVAPGAIVTLNGSASTDPQGLPLTYSWSLITRPANSNASLSVSTIVNPTFVADQPGTYVAQLTVNNGFLSSIPATVTIATASTPPVANAGANQTTSVGGTVFLNGSQSSDPNSLPLTYSWTFLSVPTGSNATLISPTTVNPSFAADLAGTYVVQLIVSDSLLSSNPSTVTITAGTFTITLSPSPMNLTSALGTLTLTLNPPAGATPISVGLSGFDPTVISVAPNPVTVPANSSGANVTVTPLGSGTTGVIASASGYNSGNVAVTVALPSVSIAFNNGATAVGLTHSIGGTVTLSAPAPDGGTTIALSGNPTGIVSFNPANVTIPQGSTSGTFTLTGTAIGPTTVIASAPFVTRGTAPMLVVNLGGISLPSGLTVGVGQSAPFNVQLQDPAPLDGTTVSLVSSDTTTLTISPASVLITAGNRTPSVQPQVTGVATGSATITASSGGYTGNSASVTVTGTVSLSPSNISVAVGGQQSITVTLSSTAPAGGLLVNLSSSNTSAATVPASVNVTGQSTTVPVTGVAPGSSTITASTSNPAYSVIGMGVAVTVPAGLAITCPAITAGTQGVSFNTGPLSVIGGTAPYTFSIVGGLASLPAGLSLNTTNGTVSGTPTATGTFTVKVTDANNVTANSCLFTINAPLSITCPANTTDTQGISFNTGALTVAGGTAPLTFSIVGGLANLPAGLSLNTSTGAVSGTPTASGTFTVQVTDARGATANSCPFTINGPLSITCPANTTGTQGTPFNTGALTVAGGTAPLTFSIVGGLASLPAGLSLNTSTGAVSGTPTASGTFTVKVTDADGAVANSCPFTINGPFSITCPTNTTGTQGAAFNTGALTVMGGTAPFTFSIVGGLANLPAGLSLNTSNGTVSGTPTAAGTFTVRVTDANGAVANSCVFTINGPVSITCPTNTMGTQGAPFTTGALSVTGGLAPYTFSIVGGLANLPAGLSLNTSNGTVSGIPTASGTFTVKVTDANNAVANSCLFIINLAPSITCPANTTGTQGVPFNSPALTVTGGTAPFTFSIIGGMEDQAVRRGRRLTQSRSFDLPAGLTLNPATGAITGTPTAAGTFTIEATDVNGAVAISCVFTVNGSPTLTITCPTTTTGVQGFVFNSGPISVMGGTAPYTFSIVGGPANLPAGLSLNTTNGTVSGAPTASGTFSIQVKDANGVAGTACAITIQPPLTITTTSLPQGAPNVAYSFQPQLSGGNAPFVWSFSGLADGLIGNPNTGAITGTPRNTASLTVTISVFDSTKPTGQQFTTQPLSLAIVSPPLAITSNPSPLGNAIINMQYLAQFIPSGGVPPYNISANTTSPSFPAWLTFDLSGSTCGAAVSICGTPTSAYIGTNTLVVTVIDSNNTTVNQTFSFMVTQLGGAGALAVQSVLVGQGLQVPMTITFSPAPTFGVSDPNGCTSPTTPGCLLVTSSNAAVMLQGHAGSSTQVLVPVAAGTTSLSLIVQGAGSSGTPSTITASAPGYNNGTGTVTIANSGFVLSGPNSIGGAFSTFQGVQTGLTVYAARLDANNLFVEPEEVMEALTVPIAVVSNTLGTVSPASLGFIGGTSSMTATFTASSANSGSGMVILTQPTQPFAFTTPAVGNNLDFTIAQSGYVAPTLTVGQNLEVPATIGITGEASSNTTVTLTSSDSSQLQFACLSSVEISGGGCSNGAPGTANPTPSGTITVSLPRNQNQTATFYAIGSGNPGSISYTISGGSFGSLPAAVTVTPSELVVQTNSATLGESPQVTVSTAAVVSGAPVIEAVALNETVSATVTSSPANIGNITTPTVSISGGSSSGTTFFQPAAVGTATITAAATGFSSGTAQQTVTSGATIQINNQVTLGQYLENPNSMILGAPAPIGGLPVSLTVAAGSTGLMQLAVNPTDPGSNSITITVPAGQSSAVYYVYALLPSGTATYGASAPGYGSATDTVTLAPSGLDIFETTPQGSPTCAANCTVSLSAGAKTFSVIVNQLSTDGNNTITGQPSLAGPTGSSAAATTGTALSGNTNLTVASGTGLAIGQLVIGSGIAPGTFLVSGGGTSWLLSQATISALNSTTLAFYNAALSVTVNNSNPAAGTLSGAATIIPGANFGTLTFTPVATGNTALSVAQPNGFISPNSVLDQVAVTVGP